MNNLAVRLYTVAASLLMPAVVLGTPITYSDQSAFTAATGSTAAALPAPGGIKNAPPAPIVLAGGEVSVTNLRYVVLDPVASTPWGNFTGYGHRLFGISGVENFNIVSTVPLSAFGFSIWEPTSSASNGCNATCYQSTFRFELFSGATSRGVFTLAPADRQWVFWGVSDADTFDRIQVKDFSNTIDNEFFSQFYYKAGTGTTAPVEDDTTPSNDENDFAVPEPASLLLTIAGLGAMVAVRRRKPVLAPTKA